MKSYKLFIIIFISSILLAYGILSYFVHGSKEDNYTQIHQIYPASNVLLNNISFEKLSQKIPFRLIAENIRLVDYESQTVVLDSLNKLDSNQSQQYLFTALSDTLLDALQKKIDLKDLNTLTSLTNEVSGLHFYSKSDKKNEIVYEALFDYWMQFITNQLVVIANDNYWYKYSFEYRYISTICQKFNYNSSTGLNDIEKVFDNFANNKYGYLFNRFILRTTLLQKTILFLLSSLLITSLIFTTYTFIKKPKHP